MASKYRIDFSSEARKQFKKLPNKIKQKIGGQIDKLPQDNSNLDITKIKGSLNIYRLRVSEYRIIYKLDGGIFTILILGISHRKESYRNINSLIKEWDIA